MEINNKIENIKEVNRKEEKEGIRDTLYGRIDVSVKTMDKVIISLVVLLAISFLLGIAIK